MKICKCNPSRAMIAWLMGLTLWSAITGDSTLLADEQTMTNRVTLPQRAKSKWSDDQLYGPYKGKSAKELWRERNGFFKSGRVPTDSNEVQRLWQWHRAMDAKDPAFGGKIPIEFYGRVLDQHGNAVPEARVDLNWGGGEDQTVAQTLVDGGFRLSGVKGASLSVSVNKDGYVTGKQSRGYYNYADFFDNRFHLPNPANPVVFRLQRLESPEPMYVWTPAAKMDVTGTVTWIDVGTGMKGKAGDIGLSVVRDEYPGERMSGYTLNLLTPQNGGLLVTNEEFMFHAPAVGYSSYVKIPHRPAQPGDQTFHPTMNVKFYLKTADGKYASVEATVIQFQAPQAAVDCIILFNPSGSQNLELGAHNRLDPAKVKPVRREPGIPTGWIRPK